MKAILSTIVFLIGAPAFAGSVCVYHIPESYYPYYGLICDGKVISKVSYNDRSSEDSVQATKDLKKLLDDGYRIVGQIDHKYTLVK